MVALSLSPSLSHSLSLPHPLALASDLTAGVLRRAQVLRLEISNVSVAQISAWEASFLKQLSFATGVKLDEYAALCSRLQQRYLERHGVPVQFFAWSHLRDFGQTHMDVADMGVAC